MKPMIAKPIAVATAIFWNSKKNKRSEITCKIPVDQRENI